MGRNHGRAAAAATRETAAAGPERVSPVQAVSAGAGPAPAPHTAATAVVWNGPRWNSRSAPVAHLPSAGAVQHRKRQKSRAPAPPAQPSATHPNGAADGQHTTQTVTEVPRRIQTTKRRAPQPPRAAQITEAARTTTAVEAVNLVITGSKSAITMPAVVTQKSQKVTSSPPSRASYYFGDFENHVNSSLVTNLSEVSEGSSTDVGVCMSDSASDISQDSLAETSDSAVSSPTVRRQSLEDSGVGGSPLSSVGYTPTPKQPSSKISCPSDAASVPEHNPSTPSKSEHRVCSSPQYERQSDHKKRQQRPKVSPPPPPIDDKRLRATVSAPQKQNNLYVSSLRLHRRPFADEIEQQRRHSWNTINGHKQIHKREESSSSPARTHPAPIQTSTPQTKSITSSMMQLSTRHPRPSTSTASQLSSVTQQKPSFPNCSARPGSIRLRPKYASSTSAPLQSVQEDMPLRIHSALIHDSEAESGFHFHLKEMESGTPIQVTEEEDSFAGVKDFMVRSADATIRSGRGTVRGVKNRVRAGIATFLQENNNTKSFKERERGKLVVYVTTMGIVRQTFAKCVRMRQILRTQMVAFEERDLFLSAANQHELRERLGVQRLDVPQLFVEGQLLGGSELVERLNESGELRRLLKPYKSAAVTSACEKCGGFRMLPCTACNGSKKSCHRNYFTCEWVVLRCCACDESGLIHCDRCAS